MDTKIFRIEFCCGRESDNKKRCPSFKLKDRNAVLKIAIISYNYKKVRDLSILFKTELKQIHEKSFKDLLHNNTY